MAITILDSASLTHKGLVRDHNEDVVYVDDAMGLYLVADGMGGHESGEVASALAKTSIIESVNLGANLPDAIMQAHHIISHKVEAATSRNLEMGTTVVCAKVELDRLSVAWVGDSRGYIYTQGELSQVTKDHSYLEFLIESGQLTPEQAINHPQRNIVTQSVGLGDPDPEDVSVVPDADMTLFLCSDGITDLVSDGYIAEVLSDNAFSALDQCNELFEKAMAAGGKDNISAVVVRLGYQPKEVDPNNMTQPLLDIPEVDITKSGNNQPLLWLAIGVAVIAVATLSVLLFSK